MKRHLTGIACLFLLFLPTAIFLQQAPPPPMAGVEVFGVEQGLQQGFVTCLTQDSEGFIWLGSTYSGLSRFDGHRFKRYVSDPFHPNSLSDNYVKNVADLGGYLFVGTTWAGGNLMHKKTERFFRLPFAQRTVPPPADPLATPVLLDSLPSPMTRFIAPGGGGSIWIYCHDQTHGIFWLCKMLPPPGFWENLPAAGRKEQAALFSKLKFECWAKKKEDLIGVLSDGKTVYQKAEDRLLIYDAGGWKPLPLPPKTVANLYCKIAANTAPGVNFWQTFDRQLLQTSDRLEVVKPLWNLPPGKFPALMSERFAWVESQGQMEIYRASDAGFDWSKPAWKLPFPDPRWEFILDKSGNFWFADRVEGVKKFSPMTARFHSEMTGGKFYHPFLTTPQGVLSYYWGGNGYGIRGEPVALADFIRTAVNLREFGPANFKTDAKGRVWAGGSAHLAMVDLAAKTAKSYDFQTSPQIPTEFVIDEKGVIWLTNREILFRLEPEKNELTCFTYEGMGLGDLPVFSMAKTADGSLWLAFEKGLLQIVPGEAAAVGKHEYRFANQAFSKAALAAQPPRFAPLFQPKTILHLTDAANRNSLSNNSIACLLTDPNDPFRLWIGTKGGGLNRLDLRTNTFTHLTSANSRLPDDAVYGILPDDVGNLWFSTNKGLVRYEPATGAIKNFRKADGLQDDEFNTWAYAKDSEGRLYFGGVKGMNVFHPKEVTDNPNKPVVLLTSLKINNLPVEPGDSSDILKEAVRFCERLVLPFSQNDLTLEFAALEFTAPSKNRYRYWLEGLEKPSHAHETNEPQAAYLNLPPGNYTFIVYGSNNDGVWSDEPAKLKIRVLPPWHRSWLAYLAYFGLALGAGFAVHRFREKQRKLKAELERQKLQAAHEAEINRLKLDDFTRHLLEKSQLIEELQAKTEHANGSQNGDENGNGNSHQDVEKLYKSLILTKEDWSEFRALFDRVYPGYVQRVMHFYPQLTSAEMRLVLLLKMGVKRPDMAIMLGISADSVRKSKHRLRLKLNLEEEKLEEVFREL